MPPATVEDLPPEHAAALRELYGEPPGQFFRGKDGVTHFDFQTPAAAGQQRSKVAVMSHGLGTGLWIYSGFVDQLLAAGFRVLRYDFYGQHWSYAADVTKTDTAMLLTQLQELLDHVLAPGEPVDLFVGHSTGGLLGVLAAAAGGLPRRIVDLALISPAFWKVVPYGPIGKMLDDIPSFVRWLGTARMTKPLKFAETMYLGNCDNAFAHEGKRYFFPDKHAAAGEDIKRMFSLHPQIHESMMWMVTTVLKNENMQAAQAAFQSLVASQTSRIGLFWGNYDVVVEFDHAKEILAWPGGDRVTLVELTGLGHEAPQEDSARVAAEIVKFASLQSASSVPSKL